MVAQVRPLPWLPRRAHFFVMVITVVSIARNGCKFVSAKETAHGAVDSRCEVSGIGEAGDLMMEISISTPMPDDGNCQVIEHLEARPLRARRGWSAEAKARLVEKTLVPGANVSAIARGADGFVAVVWLATPSAGGKRAPRPRKGFAPHLGRIEQVIEPEVPPGCEDLEKVLIGEPVGLRPPCVTSPPASSHPD